jgi:hypothetical protein
MWNGNFSDKTQKESSRVVLYFLLLLCWGMSCYVPQVDLELVIFLPLFRTTLNEIIFPMVRKLYRRRTWMRKKRKVLESIKHGSEQNGLFSHCLMIIIWVTGTQKAWEDTDQVRFTVRGTPTDKPGPEQHSPLDRPTSTWGEKEKLSNKQ